MPKQPVTLSPQPPTLPLLAFRGKAMSPGLDWLHLPDRIQRELGSMASKLLSVPPIIVNSPSYSETSGGTIVMHYLVDRLRSLGFRSYVFPWVDKDEHLDAMRQGEDAFASHMARRLTNYRLNPDFNASLASFVDLKRCIAVYPLRVKGNPLGAECVVRWHINRKSLLPEVAFSEDETHFYYNADFHEGPGRLKRSRLLRLTYAFTDHYNSDSTEERDSECFMIRKGTSYSDEGMSTIPENAIRLDGRSHAETAAIFKRSRIFYSFDLYTAYEYYAVVCGCVPVVVPRPGMTKTDWRKHEADRYGVAYGIDDIEWAVSTRERMLKKYDQEKAKEMRTVRNLTRFLVSKYLLAR